MSLIWPVIFYPHFSIMFSIWKLSEVFGVTRLKKITFCSCYKRYNVCTRVWKFSMVFVIFSFFSTTYSELPFLGENRKTSTLISIVVQLCPARNVKRFCFYKLFVVTLEHGTPALRTFRLSFSLLFSTCKTLKSLMHLRALLATPSV